MILIELLTQYTAFFGCCENKITSEQTIYDVWILLSDYGLINMLWINDTFSSNDYWIEFFFIDERQEDVWRVAKCLQAPSTVQTAWDCIRYKGIPQTNRNYLPCRRSEQAFLPRYINPQCCSGCIHFLLILFIFLKMSPESLKSWESNSKNFIAH